MGGKSGKSKRVSKRLVEKLAREAKIGSGPTKLEEVKDKKEDKEK